jgi:hypothetical protein
MGVLRIAANRIDTLISGLNEFTCIKERSGISIKINYDGGTYDLFYKPNMLSDIINNWQPE